MELMRTDPFRAAAMAALRAAERFEGASGEAGALTLTVPELVARTILAHPDWIRQLERRRGGAVTVAGDGKLGLGEHHVH